MTNPKSKISILYVDDEVHNLSAFKASFRRDHDVHLANSANEAFTLLETISPQIIIADQRMPEVTGVEFFERLHAKNPDPIRILLTAYTSSQTVIEAVNKGQIDKYLVKPWNNDLMQSTLQTGFSMYEARVALRVKNEELRRTNSELNRFVYSVSHDLRAPLMSMLGLINLAKLEKEIDSQVQLFELMEKSVIKMDNYIQTTLDYYRNFKSEISIEAVQVEVLINDIIDSLKSYHPKCKINFIHTGAKELYSDRMRLKICLSNIISNAVKYGRKNSDPYEINIQTNLTEEVYSVDVEDFGIGISEAELPKIYDMFYRSPKNKDSKSTGLGLYLVKEAIHRIKGQVTVDSVLGKGTRFKLTIPNQKK
ncbi:hybrid sensor histidine kinase/response regulator [Cryomorpha ignava]|uniref:histidine kinase n=1 Tax=Cryomorpha ignava TaxID=101383 RepID=A0A7K3WVD3_9FLAO|nr:hybrid sensor histidine kinase/response regulator [Cryomorpha ignava]NEN25663.1 hybrid sensor histidine kinase/response regulator [Cryomorpha ignava]